MKLAYRDTGEIDFICCASITDQPSRPREVRGRTVALETPAEIIAKKVYYRGSHLQPRDMFDLAAVAAHFGSDYVAAALRQCGPDACRAALGVVERADPDFVRAIIGQLMHCENTRDLVAHAQAVSRQNLTASLSA